MKHLYVSTFLEEEHGYHKLAVMGKQLPLELSGDCSYASCAGAQETLGSRLMGQEQLRFVL